jgi:hypothetical protein
VVDFSQFGTSQNQFPDPYKQIVDRGKLLIVGSGRTVWQDLELIIDSEDRDVMCLNDMIMHYPYRYQYAFSNDARMLPAWVAARRPRYAMENGDVTMHSVHEDWHGKVTKWPFPGHGYTGLNACYVGLGMGYNDIILAGVPSDDSGHYFDPPYLQYTQAYQKSKKYWLNAIPLFEGKIKSVSGMTAEWLGEPDLYVGFK